jgi:peptidoglycan/xylan/chitin deacetylase (PgdA/CDA1 family)
MLVSERLDGRATDWSGVAPQLILTDVTLTDDDAVVVRVPTRFLVAGADPSPVVLAADVVDPMLGPLGRAVVAGQPTWSDGVVDCAAIACVALTFDDGPTRTTEELLDLFGRSGDVATFFMLGPLVEQRPDVALRVVVEGHEVGNHAWSHRSLSRLPVDVALDELERTDAAIEAATGVTPELMRPPYGQYDLDLRYLGYPLALWDVDTRDWRHRDPAETVRRTLGSVRPGSVVVMHDIHASTIEAVPLLVVELKALGYTLVTMSTLTGEAEPGAVYFSQSNVVEPPPPTTTTTTTTTTTLPPG